MNGLNNREQSLVALGAALASNCVPCIEYHIPAARQAGLSDTEINEALQIAVRVRRVPARAVFETALARIETSVGGSADTAQSRCCCGESDAASGAGGVV